MSFKRFSDGAKALTLLAALTYCTSAPQAAQAQGIGATINQGLAILNGQNGQGNRRGALPPTNLDSFVYQAGGAADAIYGDESTGLPPFYGFSQDHRINAGIFGQRDAGLTTGHGSFMPDAWGADEFIGNEWSWAGASNGNYRQLSALNLNAADLLEAAIGLGVDLWDSISGGDDGGDMGGDPGMSGPPGATGGNLGSSGGLGD